MGYGAVLGQTPILTAEGIEYDNSATSGIITGSNVQQAIDQSVNKIKQNENKIQQVENNIQGGSTWELLFSQNIVKSYVYPDILSNNILASNILQNVKVGQYLSLIVKASGTMSISTTYERQTNKVKLISENGPVFHFLTSTGSNSDSCLFFMQLYSGGQIRERSFDTFYPNNSFSNGIGSNSSLVFETNAQDTSRANVQLNLQIYGLKAPTF